MTARIIAPAPVPLNKVEAVVAKPIATPACGTKVRPKYFRTSGSHRVIEAPAKAPLYLPRKRKTKYVPAIAMMIHPCSEAKIVRSKLAPETMKNIIYTGDVNRSKTSNVGPESCRKDA